jgi:hypothetical protein
MSLRSFEIHVQIEDRCAQSQFTNRAIKFVLQMFLKFLQQAEQSYIFIDRTNECFMGDKYFTSF